MDPIVKYLSKMKTAELEAELDIYRSIEGVEVPAADADELSNNEKRAGVITALREEHGYPHTITAEDLAKVPSLAADGLTEGEVALLSKEDVEALEAPAPLVPGEACTLDSGEQGIVAPDGVCVPVAGPENGPKVGDACEDAEGKKGTMQDDGKGGFTCVLNAEEVATPTPPADAANVPEDLVYRGKTVIAVRNRIINGRSYKEVELPGETQTLTLEDFAAEVRPRGEEPEA